MLVHRSEVDPLTPDHDVVVATDAIALKRPSPDTDDMGTIADVWGPEDIPA